MVKGDSSTGSGKAKRSKKKRIKAGGKGKREGSRRGEGRETQGGTVERRDVTKKKTERDAALVTGGTERKETEGCYTRGHTKRGGSLKQKKINYGGKQEEKSSTVKGVSIPKGGARKRFGNWIAEKKRRGTGGGKRKKVNRRENAYRDWGWGGKIVKPGVRRKGGEERSKTGARWK